MLADKKWLEMVQCAVGRAAGRGEDYLYVSTLKFYNRGKNILKLANILNINRKHRKEEYMYIFKYIPDVWNIICWKGTLTCGIEMNMVSCSSFSLT